MRKEKLTMENIKKDLSEIISCELSIAEDWRFQYIIPISLLAVVLGILFQSVLVGLAVFTPAAYHIVRFAISAVDNKNKKAALASAVDRGDVSISVKKLSHIAEQTVYEPHLGYRRARSTREAIFFHFEGGSSWRLHNTYKHYEWSRDFAFSGAGLCNVSIAGDEFYYVVLQKEADVAYVYPCKYFELDSSLEA